MPPQSQPPRVLRFGIFEIDIRAGELRKNGVKLKLQEQPFQVLCLLVEHPNEVVTREELRSRLWPADTFVDFDHSLNAAIKRLRDALGDSAETPRFVETLARRGYRFVVPVEKLDGSGHSMEGVSRQGETVATNQNADSSGFAGVKRRFRFAIAIVGLAGAVVAAAMFWLGPLRKPPRVKDAIQLTNDGLPKGSLVTDGSRVYFVEKRSGQWVIEQMATSGGESTEIPTPFSGVQIYDISPNGSELLVGGDVVQKLRQLWVLPVPAGPPYRVSNVLARAACWAPDGVHIAYASGNDLYMVKKDGTEAHKLVTVTGVPSTPQFSPDGRRLRFTVLDTVQGTLSLWEVTEDGKGHHPVVPESKILAQNCCGRWSHDGSYFYFQTFFVNKQLDHDVWVLPEPGSILKKSTEPVRLTSGPLAFGSPVPGVEREKLFVRGTQARAELLRYDTNAGQLVSYLSGISARDVEVSRDGKWVTYVAYPELTLWRSRVNGTERMQLAFPPVEAFLPRWSPDGSQIVFTDLQLGKTGKIYLVSRDGGRPQEVMPKDELAEIDPTWSPDSASIVFGRSHQDPNSAIFRVELKTRQISRIPGSDALTAPRMSPDGRYIVALSRDWSKLMLYDFRTGKWVELAAVTKGALGYPNWSHDGKYVYMGDFSSGYEIERVSITDHKIQRIFDASDVPQPSPSWNGLAADDSPLLWRDKSAQEIYLLDLDFP